MKVIRVDNYDREIYPDEFIVGGLTDAEARAVADQLNAKNMDSDWWYVAKADDYKLFEGPDD